MGLQSFGSFLGGGTQSSGGSSFSPLGAAFYCKSFSAPVMMNMIMREPRSIIFLINPAAAGAQ